MIKCVATTNFTLKDFHKLKNIVRKVKGKDGELNKGDEFECDEEMAKYLTGDNPKKKIVVKILEVIPETNATINFTEKEMKPKVKKQKKKRTNKKKEE